MDALSVISSIVASINSNDSPPQALSFVYGNDYENNLAADNENFPAAFLDFPFESVMEIAQSGYIAEAVNVSIFFCDKTDVDADPADHLFVIRQCHAYMKSFLNKLQNSQYVNTIENVNTQGVINLFDVNVSGVLLTAAVEFKNTDSIC